ncbi:Transposable element Hobo transposase-like 2, partial [Homarus americanus]
STQVTEDYSGLPAQHIPCFAHMLQLVIKDGLKNATQLNRILDKTAKIVSYVRRSTVATELLEGENRVEAANVTRWNSQVKMVRSVLALPEDKFSLLKEDVTLLGAYEKNMLQDIVQEATDYAQRQNTVSASKVVTRVRGPRQRLEQRKSKYNNNFVAALKSSPGKRLTQYEASKQFGVAAVPDPHFKARWCQDHMEKTDLTAEFTAQITANCGMLAAPVNASSPPKKRCKIASFMEDPDAN